MTENYSNNPAILYRGLVVPARNLSDDLFVSPMLPRGEYGTNDSGRRIGTDGNEHGVYMSDNQHMAEFSYATPRNGDPIPNSPTFNWKGASQSRVEIPRIGFLFEIDGAGLDLRVPQIGRTLSGVYNNGFEGSEWITDIIPAGSYKVLKLKLGPDMLHPMEDIAVGVNHQVDLEKLRLKIENRIGKLAATATLISSIDTRKRQIPGVVDRMIAANL